jgi:hypothetical protein
MSYASPEPHPVTGVRIVVVIPDSVALSEVRASYSRLAETRPWLSLLDERDFFELQSHTDWSADDLFVLSWGLVVPGRDATRRAKIGVVYSEAIGEPSSMLPQHRADLRKLEALACSYSLVLGHTPWMAAQLGRTGLPDAVLPLGWDPSMGQPDFQQEKRLPAVFYGSMVGKRLWSVPAMQRALGDWFHDRSGWFGPRLTAELNHASTVLYLAHSDVGSFSTWRAWQAVSSSAVLVAEPGDTWPFEAERHFVPLPRLTPENIDEAAHIILKAVEDRKGSAERAQRAHEEVALKWTTERIVDETLVDLATRMIRGVF